MNVAAADVHIIGDDLFTESGDIFLLGDNISAPRQTRVVRFATRDNLTLLRFASTWLADVFFSFYTSDFGQFWMIHDQVMAQALLLSFFFM